LILTATQADKRKKIYKTIHESGMIIDCSVAKGVRKADLDQQHAVMQHVAAQVLTRYKKTLAQPAFQALVDLTGFNLDLFCRNLEKLAAYTADRRQISEQDVKTVVVREKKDPIFNFTNAVMAKQAASALFFLNSLLDEGFHPLQILKSLENLFRKLILVSDFLNHAAPDKTNIKQMPFNRFQQTLLPKIVEQDQKTIKKIEERELYLTGAAPKKKDLPPDLFLAPNPKNAYPVFQLFLKSENFSISELRQVLLFLSDLDYHLKTSQVDVRTQIEHLIIKLCSKGGFVHAQENQDHRHYL
jgi:DNA polymerase-3 subunit delta